MTANDAAEKPPENNLGATATTSSETEYVPEAIEAVRCVALSMGKTD